MTDLAALHARAKTLVEAIKPRHERAIPFCPHTPTEQQRKFLQLDLLEALYGGAAGGGKSDAVLMAALMYADVPGYAALILRRTYADLALPGAIMDRAREWLTGSGASWSEKEKRWTFPSGATLTFGYCETDADVYRYQGSEFQFIGIDELTQWSEFAYRYLLSRLRRLAGVDIPLRMRAGTNPGGVGHAWVKERLVEIDAGHPSRRFVPAKLEDNPHLDREAYEKALAELDDDTRDHLRHGLWIVGKKGRIYRFDRTKNVVAALPRTHGWKIVLSIDLGSSETVPTTAFVLLAVHPHERVTYVLRSWAVEDMAPGDFADVCKTLRGQYGEEMRVVMDEGGLGAGYARELRRRYGIPVAPAQKRDKNGFRRLLNGAFKQAAVQLLEGENDDLAAELETVLWDKHGLDVAPGMADHLSDALLYGWRDTRSDLATTAPAAEPAYGTPEWHAERARKSEEQAYERARQSAAQEARGETWERW